MEPTRIRSGPQHPHTTGPSHSQPPYVSIFRAHLYSAHWIRAQALFSPLRRHGTAMSVWQCGNKLGRVPRKRGAWCCSAMVVFKVRVVLPVKGYESRSNSDLVPGRVPWAYNGHSTGTVPFICGEVKLFKQLSCGHCWAQVGRLRYLPCP